MPEMENSDSFFIYMAGAVTTLKAVLALGAVVLLVSAYRSGHLLRHHFWRGLAFVIGLVLLVLGLMWAYR